MLLRHATRADAPAIAALHARSWQLAYRGDFSDHYLDVECPAERLQVWTERFATPNPDMITRVLEDPSGDLIGFCCTFLHYDTNGHYLDNLHVAAEHQGAGHGKRLLLDTANEVNKLDPEGEIYLLVLTSNSPAIAFYERMGGRLGKVSTKDLAGTLVEVVAVHWRVAVLGAC